MEFLQSLSDFINPILGMGMTGNILSIIFLCIGPFILFMKGIFLLARYIVKKTVTPKDDEILEKVEHNWSLYFLPILQLIYMFRPKRNK